MYNPDFAFAENSRPDYKVKDSLIMFRGLDKFEDSEGFSSDIIFINEALSGVSKEQYENVTMRCKLMVIMDWNPRYTKHWIFELEGRPNMFFNHSTFKDNPHCPEPVKQKILSYEPTPENVAAGTADEYRWKVYGQGVRAAQDGLVFPKITWIDAFPDDLAHTVLGMDFGFTNDPSVLVRAGVRDNNLYLHELFYHPVIDPELLYELVSPFFGKHDYCYADSSDKYATNCTGQIQVLQAKGLPIIPVKKYHGSIVDGISIMQNFHIHIVKTRNAEIEANSYIWDSVNGIPINKPKDEYNHFWDASRYAVISELKHFLK